MKLYYNSKSIEAQEEEINSGDGKVLNWTLNTELYNLKSLCQKLPA